jgi:hypothetical protein
MNKQIRAEEIIAMCKQLLRCDARKTQGVWTRTRSDGFIPNIEYSPAPLKNHYPDSYQGTMDEAESNAVFVIAAAYTAAAGWRATISALAAALPDAVWIAPCKDCVNGRADNSAAKTVDGIIQAWEGVKYP